MSTNEQPIDPLHLDPVVGSLPAPLAKESSDGNIPTTPLKDRRQTRVKSLTSGSASPPPSEFDTGMTASGFSVGDNDILGGLSDDSMGFHSPFKSEGLPAMVAESGANVGFSSVCDAPLAPSVSPAGPRPPRRTTNGLVHDPEFQRRVSNCPSLRASPMCSAKLDRQHNLSPMSSLILNSINPNSSMSLRRGESPLASPRPLAARDAMRPIAVRRPSEEEAVLSKTSSTTVTPYVRSPSENTAPPLP